jgi:limonene-1,2-epoxide hydrolase
MTNAEIAETYLDAFRSKDPSKALLAPNASLQYPLTPRDVVGKENIAEYMSSVMPGIDDVTIERRLVDGDYVAILWSAQTVWGLIKVCSVFRISDGLIAEVRAFFDPRPIVHDPADRRPAGQR